MKSVAAATVATALAIALAVTSVLAVPADTYAATWDNLDLDALLANDRLVKNYVDCLLDRGTCPPDGAALKRILPEALETGCAKCTQKQKEGAVRVVKFMLEKKPELWQEIMAKFDPEGTYRKQYSG